MPGRSKWSVVIIACIAIFIIVLDSSAMNVAISALVKDLHTSLSFIQAIIAIYALVMASFMLLGSKIQDILGRKRTFLIGTMIYGCGTLTATCSVNAWMLLVGWALLEGIGAALMLPATTTLVSAEYKGKDRVVAFGIWGGIAATGAAVGPIVGGFFTTYLSWRLVFGSEILFVIAILLLRSRLSESSPDMGWKELDKTGAVLSVSSLFLFVFGVLVLRTPDMWPLVPLLIVPGIALFVTFLYLQGRRARKGKEPLFDVSLLKVRAFNVGNLTNMTQQLALAGVLFVVPVFLQQVTKTSAMKTGLALLPLSLSIFVFSLVGGKFLVVLRQAKYVAILGFAISAVGFFLLRNDFAISTSITDLIPGFLVLGFGTGLLLSQLTNVTMSAARGDQEAGASGFLNTSKNLGYSLGTALIGVLLIMGVFHGLTTSLSASSLGAGMTEEQVKTSLVDYVQTMQTSPPPGIPEDQVPEATEMVDSALSSGMKMCFNVLAILMLLGMVISFFMPKTKPETEPPAVSFPEEDRA
jgi:EmrB/QacA subfamily drug resistance transporter